MLRAAALALLLAGGAAGIDVGARSPPSMRAKVLLQDEKYVLVHDHDGGADFWNDEAPDSPVVAKAEYR
jgi:hypothetical protein